MKIDSTKPRIPLHRLKYPIEAKKFEPDAAAEDEIETTNQSESSDAFERAIIKKGASKFKEWLNELEIK